MPVVPKDLFVNISLLMDTVPSWNSEQMETGKMCAVKLYMKFTNLGKEFNSKPSYSDLLWVLLR